MEHSRNETLIGIGERIRNEREKRGLTQAELAGKLKKIDIPISRQKIAKWETGIQAMQAEEIIKVANFFDVFTDYLLGLSDVQSKDTELKGVCEYTNLSEAAVKLLHSGTKNRIDVLSSLIENYNFWAMIDKITKYREMYQQAYFDENWLSDEEFNPSDEKFNPITDNAVTKSAEEAQFVLFQIQKLLNKIIEEGAKNGKHTGKAK